MTPKGRPSLWLRVVLRWSSRWRRLMTPKGPENVCCAALVFSLTTSNDAKRRALPLRVVLC
jgi:hypothetical protein